MDDPKLKEERRHFYRHPADVPIQVFPQKEALHNTAMSDFSEGGLAFQTNVYIQRGKLLRVCIPYVDPPFEASCIVCWQRLFADGNYEVGVMFSDEQTAFRVKMVEQLCQIKKYQKQCREHGCDISFQQAASKWIEKYAADFDHN